MSATQSPNPSVAFYFLDVGQGDCSFIVGPRAEIDPILIDCADADVALHFVRDHQYTKLHSVVASHLDDDHIRGLLEFLQSFLQQGGTVGTVYIGTDRGRQTATGRTLIKAVLRWEREGRLSIASPWRETQPRQIYRSNDWFVEIVLPYYGTVLGEQVRAAANPNLASAVVRAVVGGQPVLMGADAPLASWERLDALIRQALIVRVPHHGGDLSERPAALRIHQMYDSIQANTAVVSVGSRNQHGHPDRTHVIAARRGGACRVLCTQLTEQCGGKLLRVRTARDEQRFRTRLKTQLSLVEPPYRHRGNGHRMEMPCAGSVVTWINFGGQVEVLPEPGDWHDEFVRKLPSAMCR